MSAVTLVFPPEAGELWSLVEGRICKAAAYRAWLSASREAIRESAQPPIFGPYRLMIVAHRPEQGPGARRDLDSLLGPLVAALTGAGVVGGDALAERITIRWMRDGAPGGTLEVEARLA